MVSAENNCLEIIGLTLDPEKLVMYLENLPLDPGLPYSFCSWIFLEPFLRENR